MASSVPREPWGCVSHDPLILRRRQPSTRGRGLLRCEQCGRGASALAVGTAPSGALRQGHSPGHGVCRSRRCASRGVWGAAGSLVPRLPLLRARARRSWILPGAGPPGGGQLLLRPSSAGSAASEPLQRQPRARGGCKALAGGSLLKVTHGAAQPHRAGGTAGLSEGTARPRHTRVRNVLGEFLNVPA